MPFNDIFLDLYNQASRTSHAFTSRFLASMTDPHAKDIEQAWKPSVLQPEPTCLGDFLKMLGQRLPEDASNAFSTVHVTITVRVKELVEEPPESHFAIIETAMQFSQRTWTESHVCGELSKYGNFPSSGWAISLHEAINLHWIPNPAETLREPFVQIEDEDHAFLDHGPIIQFKEDDNPLLGASADKREEMAAEDERSVFVQARRILDHMCCGTDPTMPNRAQESDWRIFKDQMRPRWSRPLLHTMALLAAMISCHICLSAAVWVNEYFVPVAINYDRNTTVLGLLARHARLSERCKARKMLSIGRHPNGKALGMDLVLVDHAISRAPVGIIPNFLQVIRSDDEFVERMKVLYAGLLQSVTPRGANIMFLPLKSVSLKQSESS